jgi:hypothetical protein
MLTPPPPPQSLHPYFSLFFFCFQAIFSLHPFSSYPSPTAAGSVYTTEAVIESNNLDRGLSPPSRGERRGGDTVMEASMTMPSRLLKCELMSTPHADIFHLSLNHSSTLRSRMASRVRTLVFPCRLPGSLPTLYVIFRPNFRSPGDGCTQSAGFGPHRCAIARPSELQGILKHIY